MKRLEEEIVNLLTICGRSGLGREQIPFILKEYSSKEVYESMSELIKKGVLYEGIQNMVGLSMHKRKSYLGNTITRIGIESLQ